MCRWLLFVHFVTQSSPPWHLLGEGSAQLGAGLPGQGQAEPSLCHSISYIPSHAHARPAPGPSGSPHRGTALALLPTSILYLPAVSNKGSSTFAAVGGFLWLWFTLWVHENAQGCFGWVLVGLGRAGLHTRGGQTPEGFRLLGTGTEAG